MLRPPLPAFLALALALAAGCGEEPAHHEVEVAGGHVHKAPHGGILVVLADEAVNLELVHDPAAAKLTAFLLDGHAESGLRVAQPSIALSLRRGGGDPFDLVLASVANALTGETAGDSSEFAATDDRLRGHGAIDGVVRSLVVKGTAFSDVSFHLPEAAR